MIKLFLFVCVFSGIQTVPGWRQLVVFTRSPLTDLGSRNVTVASVKKQNVSTTLESQMKTVCLLEVCIFEYVCMCVCV